MSSIPVLRLPRWLAQNQTHSYRGNSGVCPGCSFLFFRGIKMYQDNNILEKARASPNTVAMILSIFLNFRVWC
jgi:hypothetical protein